MFKAGPGINHARMKQIPGLHTELPAQNPKPTPHGAPQEMFSPQTCFYPVQPQVGNKCFKKTPKQQSNYKEKNQTKNTNESHTFLKAVSDTTIETDHSVEGGTFLQQTCQINSIKITYFTLLQNKKGKGKIKKAGVAQRTAVQSSVTAFTLLSFQKAA